MDVASPPKRHNDSTTGKARKTVPTKKPAKAGWENCKCRFRETWPCIAAPQAQNHGKTTTQLSNLQTFQPKFRAGRRPFPCRAQPASVSAGGGDARIARARESGGHACMSDAVPGPRGSPWRPAATAASVVARSANGEKGFLAQAPHLCTKMQMAETIFYTKMQLAIPFAATISRRWRRGRPSGRRGGWCAGRGRVPVCAAAARRRPLRRVPPQAAGWWSAAA